MSLWSKKQKIAIVGLTAVWLVVTNVVFAISSGAWEIGKLFDDNNKLYGEKISNASISVGKLQDNSVTTAKIKDGSITDTKVNKSEVQVAVKGTCLNGINEIKIDGTLICADVGAIAPPPTYSCTWSDPTNATLVPSDDMSLTVDTTKTLVATDTTAKCEYTCNPGYSLAWWTCQPTVVYCTAGGSVPCVVGP